MAKDPETELAANVKEARTKRMHFAFVAQGSSDGALVLAKAKVPPVLIADAKKRSGGTTVYQGTCIGADGKLVFEFPQEPPATMEATLKKVIHRDAGITEHCVCRAVGTAQAPPAHDMPKSPPSLPTKAAPNPYTVPVFAAEEEEEEKAMEGIATQASTSAAKPPEVGAGDLASQYSVFHQSIELEVVKALKTNTGDVEKIKTAYNFAHDHASKHEYDKALQGLHVLKNLLHEGYSAGAVGHDAAPGSGYVTSVKGSEPKSAAYVTSVRDEIEIDPIGTDEEEEEDDLDSDEEQETDEALAAKLKEANIKTAQAKLKPNRIESDWAKKIDLAKCKVSFPGDAPEGAYGRLGFIASSDPGAPPLAVKVPLHEKVNAELEKEVEYYKKVGENPRFAKCLGIADVDGQRGLVLEQIKGKDMGQSMKMLRDQYDAGKVSHEQYWGAVQHTMRQTLEAIAHMESVGVVHNDIRMANIICDQTTGDMKVIDFGVSTMSGETVPTAPWAHGTVSPDTFTRDEGGKPVPQYAKNAEGKLAAEKDWARKGAVTSKHDVYSVGAATYEAGEKKSFSYLNAEIPALLSMDLFVRPAKDGSSKKAVNPATADQTAFTKDDKGTAKKVVGRSGADTAYTDFINRLMDPDPKKRLSPAAALKEPFLADSLLDEEQAKQVFRNLLAPPPKSAAAAESKPEALANPPEDGYSVHTPDQGYRP